MDRSYWPARIIDSTYIVTYKCRQSACRVPKYHGAGNDRLTSFSSLPSSSLSALFRRPWNQDLIDLFFTYTCLSSSLPTYHHRSYSTLPIHLRPLDLLHFRFKRRNKMQRVCERNCVDSTAVEIQDDRPYLYEHVRVRQTKRNGFLPPVRNLPSRSFENSFPPSRKLYFRIYACHDAKRISHFRVNECERLKHVSFRKLWNEARKEDKTRGINGREN